METKRISIKGIPIDVWKNIKIMAINENITIEALVTKILSDYIDKIDNKKAKKAKK